MTRVEPRPSAGHVRQEPRASDEVRVLVLGSTGSIGTQTLDVVAHLNREHAAGRGGKRYRVVGLAGGKNVELLRKQQAQFGVKHAVLSCEDGADSAERLVREVECDIVLAAIVGAAGLPATLAAVRLGRDVALANKETLVAAGSLIVPAAGASGSRLLPVDSEHSAIWQCLLSKGQGTGMAMGPGIVPPMACGADVARVVLTASGGPFRSLSKAEAYHKSPREALAHPTWTMGAKVTIDSASLTNKAFELIEAHWLYGLEWERLAAVIHPQSIVHSFVEFADGSVIAQMGPPDMRTPIQYALTFPDRPAGTSRKLDWAGLKQLDFMPADAERFPALGCAERVIRDGGTSGAVFNAASEEAVGAFLAEGSKVPFGRLPELAQEAMEKLGVSAVRDLDDVLEADAAGRAFVKSRL